MAQQLKKLFIIRGQLRGPMAIFNASDESSVFSACFNPNEYAVEKRSSFAEMGIPGLGSQVIQYNRGESQTLSLEMLLDTYTYNNKEDVRSIYIKKLEALLEIDPELHAPPPCKVIWGSLEFVGVAESLRKNYLFFLEDGTPVRARVTLSLKEYIPLEMQMLRTPRFSPDRRKAHTIQEGDTLWNIAYNAYGKAKYWKFLAEANNIANPLQLVSGSQIILPPIEESLTSDHGS